MLVHVYLCGVRSPEIHCSDIQKPDQPLDRREPHFRRIPKNILSFEVSSGGFSTAVSTAGLTTVPSAVDDETDVEGSALAGPDEEAIANENDSYCQTYPTPKNTPNRDKVAAPRRCWYKQTLRRSLRKVSESSVDQRIE
jgi:hypothetical protein